MICRFWCGHGEQWHVCMEHDDNVNHLFSYTLLSLVQVGVSNAVYENINPSSKPDGFPLGIVHRSPVPGVQKTPDPGTSERSRRKL